MIERTDRDESHAIRLARVEDNLTRIFEDIRYIRREVTQLVANENQRIGEGRMAKTIFGIAALMAGALGGAMMHILNKLF